MLAEREPSPRARYPPRSSFSFRFSLWAVTFARETEKWKNRCQKRVLGQKNRSGELKEGQRKSE